MHTSVNIGDTDLWVWQQGDGTPLVLIHGFPMDGRLWIDGPATPDADRCRSIVPDMRGFGESPATEATMSPAAMADDVARLLDVLEINEPVVLGGLSMGGYVALAFHQKYRERLAGLILCDTRAEADSPEMKENRRQTAESVLVDGPDRMVEGMIEKLVAPETLLARHEITAALREMGVAQSRQGIASAALGMAERADMTEQLSEINVPTLLIVGEEDVITPPALMGEMAKAIGQNARLVEIPWAGHATPLEQPALVKSAIENFLAEIA